MVWIDQHVKNIKILEKAKTILESLEFDVFFYLKKLFIEFENIRLNPQ